MERVRAAIVLVALHYVVNLAHGVPHRGVPVELTVGQQAFVVLVVGVGPLVSLWLLRTGRSTQGWVLLAAVLAVSFLFGTVFHYVLDTADHVANVPPGTWQGPFVWTAHGITVVDGGGAVLALWTATQSWPRGAFA